jgi:hypothetical protein
MDVGVAHSRGGGVQRPLAEQRVELRTSCRTNRLATGVRQGNIKAFRFPASMNEAGSLEVRKLASKVRSSDERWFTEISLTPAPLESEPIQDLELLDGDPVLGDQLVVQTSRFLDVGTEHPRERGDPRP